MRYFDLHRHDERSLFDGFGKPVELANIAKELGYKALGVSNHGDVSALISHYFECKNVGIKPILGDEVYFVPKFSAEAKARGSHLCLFVKNLQGYKNLNKIVSYSNKKQYYYKPIVDFKLLEKYHDGLICTSACIGGVLSKLITDDKYDVAIKAAKRFVKIFGDDFYIEIQPYKLSDEGLQESCNVMLMKLAKELNIKCILTSDSHFGRKEDFDTYLKMHEIGGHLEMGKQYSQRYMPSEKQISKRFLKMHGVGEYKVKNAERKLEAMLDNVAEIAEKVDDEILEKLELVLPKFDGELDSKELLWNNIKSGLKEKGKLKKGYVKRCKEEYDVVCYHGFEDYFLIVQDYVKWAKNKGIEVGPGRGSVCNCLIAYALDITEVDSLLFDLDFRRFLRKDKKKLPDIDIDFETDRRSEVIDYLVKKYKGGSARICSYGLYKTDILLNDLFKVCGLNALTEEDEYEKKNIKNIQDEIKSTIKQYIDKETNELNMDAINRDDKIAYYNRKYDDIIKHFTKIYKKVRYYGTHAAGVAITGSKLSNYTALERRAANAFTTAYDLVDIEMINGIKFDMLGLKTMSVLKELRDLCGKEHRFDYDMLYDDQIYEQFAVGNTDGIFQFESKGAQEVLRLIEANCYQDVMAASALNRPGPLSLGMVSKYADSKQGVENSDDSHNEKIKEIFDEYASDTYGCFVYQEQVMKICHYVAGMEWSDADKIMKMMKNNKTFTEKALKEYNEQNARLHKLFVEGAVKNGYDKKVADEVFENLQVYTFNKGHAYGYGLISIEQMYYKVHYPLQFWYITLKYAKESDIRRLSSQAVRDGNIILLPHVNFNSTYSIVEVDGEECIAAGTLDVKNVGAKAAEIIMQERLQNGNYKDLDDFMDRMAQYKSIVNKRVLNALTESGALEFDQQTYFVRCEKYNATLYQ